MNLLSNLILLADEVGTTGTNVDGGQQGSLLGGSLGMLIPMILIVVLMYFMMIRPQKKKQKEEQQMRNNLRVGDELTTIGGIKGRVVSIKDDTITIESGADRTKIQFMKWAIQSVETKHDTPVDDDDDDDDDI